MSELTQKERDALPNKAFALPGRRYPIHNVEHARNALARVAQNGTPDEQRRVRAAVHRRYPSVDFSQNPKPRGGNPPPPPTKKPRSITPAEDPLTELE